MILLFSDWLPLDIKMRRDTWAHKTVVIWILVLLLIDLNRAHWQLILSFKVDLWWGLGASDVATLTHNNLNLFITVHCQFANPLRKSNHISTSTEFCTIWELLLLFRCLLLSFNSFALIIYGLSIISYKVDNSKICFKEFF